MRTPPARRDQSEIQPVISGLADLPLPAWMLDIEDARALTDHSDFRVGIVAPGAGRASTPERSGRPLGDSPVFSLEPVFDDAGELLGCRRPEGIAILHFDQRAAFSGLSPLFLFVDAMQAPDRAQESRNKPLRPATSLRLVEKVGQGRHRNVARPPR
jgi:hypothetical protein